jgi:diaminohydroxyphosphoribosylaminopyrimidine deaminase/5-amino-6-(5-phosphoribosylamino)uracil reductase
MTDLSLKDAHYMAQALAQAGLARGSTSPNPPVGAVLVRDGEVLGEGCTQPAGGAHAEAEALKMARDRGLDTVGATFYVTLEPCGHFGRTPPCTDSLIASGVTRVVIGVIDPDARMNGKSVSLLRAAGIDVDVGVLAEESAAMILGFSRAVGEGMPEVTCKAAMSLDGNIATTTGESKWITGDLARQDGHQLRASHDAILVGVGTILADDPALTCRSRTGVDPTPVVLDTNGRTPASAKIFSGTKTPIILCHEDAVVELPNAKVVRVARGADGLDITAALQALVEQGLHRVLIEGGGAVHRSAFDANVVDTLHLYVAPVLIPGGRSWLGGKALNSLAGARRFTEPSVTPLGQDIRVSWLSLRDTGA